MLQTPKASADLPRITDLRRTKKAKRSWRVDYAKASNKFELNFIPRAKLSPESEEKLQPIVENLERQADCHYYYIRLNTVHACQNITIYGLAYPRDEEGEPRPPLASEARGMLARTKVTVYWVNKPEQTLRNKITKEFRAKVAEIVTARFEQDKAKKTEENAL